MKTNKQKYFQNLFYKLSLPKQWVQADLIVDFVHTDSVQRELEQGDSPPSHSRDGAGQAQPGELQLGIWEKALLTRIKKNDNTVV